MLRCPKKTYAELETIDYSSCADLEKMNEVVGMPKVKNEIVDGRVIPTVVFEVTPVEKMNHGLTVDDFALENLLANGYQPKRVDFNATSFDDIDNISKHVANLPKINVNEKIVES